MYIMSKFVKIEGYEGWFLVIDNIDQTTNSLNEQMQERLERYVGGEIKQEGDKRLFLERFSCITNNKIDYRTIFKKYSHIGSLLIREIGSYMFLTKDLKITEIVYSECFPNKQSTADIIVCENDFEADAEWINYLTKRFKDKKIKVLYFFNSRDNHEIKKVFEKATLITFSTTFTNTEWFEKLIANLTYQKVIGFCWDFNKWGEIEHLYRNVNIEIIENLT